MKDVHFLLIITGFPSFLMPKRKSWKHLTETLRYFFIYNIDTVNLQDHQYNLVEGRKLYILFL